MTLTGRGAVVTGGGRGIGAAVARALAGAGARVLVAARHPAEVEAVAAGLRGAGAEAFAARCDVTDGSSVTELARTARDQCLRGPPLVEAGGHAPRVLPGHLQPDPDPGTVQ